MENSSNPNSVQGLGIVVETVNGKEEIFALLSEYMDKKDLHSIVHSSDPKEKLSVFKKFRVLIDIASGMCNLLRSLSFRDGLVTRKNCNFI